MGPGPPDEGPAAAAARRRVLLTATTFPRWAGDVLPVFVLELARALVRQGVEVHLLAPHAAGARTEEILDGIRVRRFRYAPARWERLAYGHGIVPNVSRNPWLLLLVPGFLAAQLGSVLRLLRREGIRCLNAHWIFPQGFVGAIAKAAQPGLRLVVTVHGGDIATLGRRAAFRPMLRWTMRRAEVVTAVSAETAAGVRGVCPQAPLSRISMGVDAARFRPRAEASAARRRLAPEGGPLLLFCGRLAQKKGVRHLVEALPAVLARVPDAGLAIVGDGEEREGLERLVRERGLGAAVRFVGAVPNEALPDYYAAADIVCCPSIVDSRGDTEGLPVVALEAAACGLPVVASRVGGMAEAVRDGETGILVPQKDPAALAAAVVGLLEDPARRRRMGERGRRMVEEEFTWDGIARRFAAELFPRAAAEPARRDTP